ncbi:MAG: hypothetical protein IKF82_05320 [Bacilli bacterium]|nr:hypothetical protein [Bacilli bacterium]
MSQENNFIPDLQPYKKISPFRLFVKSNFPFIENTYESLDNYGLYCKVVEYLNNVIANENTVENNVQALYNAFVELNTYVSNYFDNLDVQEEINNKLDDMVEQGTLQEIISAYLNSQAIFGYNNVSDMVSAENLVDGSYAKTLGYYSKNDGGKALYKIRTRTFADIIDNGSIIEMDNENLVAELIESNVNIKQFGAYGDETHDDTNAIQKAINYSENVFIPKGIYKVTDTLLINKPLYLHGNGSESILELGDNITTKYLSSDNNDYGSLIHINKPSNSIYPRIATSNDNTIFEDFVLYGNARQYNAHAITCLNVDHLMVTNVTVEEFKGSALRTICMREAMMTGLNVRYCGDYETDSATIEFLYDSNTDSNNLNAFSNCMIINSFYIALRMDSSHDNVFTNCHFHQMFPGETLSKEKLGNPPTIDGNTMPFNVIYITRSTKVINELNSFKNCSVLWAGQYKSNIYVKNQTLIVDGGVIGYHWGSTSSFTGIEAYSSHVYISNLNLYLNAIPVLYDYDCRIYWLDSANSMYTPSRTIYVDTVNGTDDGLGTNEKPYKNITRALNGMQYKANYTLIIKDTANNSPILTDVDFTNYSNIKSLTIDLNNKTFSYLYFKNCSFKLIVENGTFTASRSDGAVQFDNCKDVKVTNLTVGGIVGINANLHSILEVDSSTTSSSTVGISASKFSDITVNNNNIIGEATYQLRCYDLARVLSLGSTQYTNNAYRGGTIIMYS